jgi:hypothetical protein
MAQCKPDVFSARDLFKIYTIVRPNLPHFLLYQNETIDLRSCRGEFPRIF